jgi:hypothetical protein
MSAFSVVRKGVSMTPAGASILSSDTLRENENIKYGHSSAGNLRPYYSRAPLYLRHAREIHAVQLFASGSPAVLSACDGLYTAMRDVEFGSVSIWRYWSDTRYRISVG